MSSAENFRPSADAHDKPPARAPLAVGTMAVVAAIVAPYAHAQDDAAIGNPGHSQEVAENPAVVGVDELYDGILRDAVAAYVQDHDVKHLEALADAAKKRGDVAYALRVAGEMSAAAKNDTVESRLAVANVVAGLQNWAQEKQASRTTPAAPQAAVSSVPFPAPAQRVDQYVHEGLPEYPSSVVVYLEMVKEESRISGRSPVTVKMDGWKIHEVGTRNPELSTKKTVAVYPTQGFVVSSGPVQALPVAGFSERAGSAPNRSQNVEVSYDAANGILTVAGVPFSIVDFGRGPQVIDARDGRSSLRVWVSGAPSGRPDRRPRLDIGR